MKKLLDYRFPEDLKTMSERELGLLAYEIRDFLIEHVSKTGGHVASSLGVVELTIALHAFFDSPRDKIIWDVGHQAYIHKILTGRGDRFETLRQEGGLSGFPKRKESPHDICDSGHASTSVSTALGLAVARDRAGEDYDVITVIGDGSLTGGVAFEALNHAGGVGSKMIVILNDNNIAIGKNTGSLSQHLGRLRASQTYLDIKKSLKNATRNSPKIYSGLEHFRDSLKYAFLPGTIFEELGFTYFGPIDGHDIHDLMEVFSLTRALSEPILLHVVTKKGKGYRNAECQPEKFHGVGPFNPSTGNGDGKETFPCYSKIFGGKLSDMAGKDLRISAVSAAMIDGTGLSGFAKRFPDRLYDVGIAEQHAVSFAAGLALGGQRPFVAIYSTFLQRAYDEIMMDVCLQNLPVVFAVDRAGNVGADGETHHGLFDLSYLSSLPNMTVMMPADGRELTQMMEYAVHLGGPCAIRYPRGEAIPLPRLGEMRPIDGRCEVLKEGKDVTLLAAGKMALTALRCDELLRLYGLDAEIINPRFLRPLDWETISASADKTGRVVTLEDNVLTGGFGSAVSSLLSDRGMTDVRLLRLGWPSRFICHGDTDSMMRRYGLDPLSVAERIGEFLERKD